MKRLFNDGWEFCKQPLETSLEQVQKKMQDFYRNLRLDDFRWKIYTKTEWAGITRNSTGQKRKKNWLYFGLMEFTWTAVSM